MPFTINEDSLLIRGRKGDSATFTFDFNQDMSDYKIDFFIKKNIDSKETIIKKEYANPVEQVVSVTLTSEDTSKLSANGNTYQVFYWGLRVSKGTDYVQTIIPTEFNNPPMMYIYPEIGGV